MGTFEDILVVLLQRFGRVALQDTGTLFLKNHSASLINHRTAIEPPFETVAFTNIYEPDYDPANLTGRVRILSNISVADIRKLTDDWLNHLNTEKTASLKGIGTFSFKSSELIFEPSPDKFNGQYYSMESVNVKAVPIAHPRNNSTAIDHVVDTGTLVYRSSDTTANYRYLMWPAVAILLCILILAGRSISCNEQKSIISPPVVLEPNDTAVVEKTKDAVEEETTDQTETTDTLRETASIPSFTGECVIIVGSFTKQSNAKRMILRVEKAGYTPYFENANGRVRVGMSFECREDDLTDSMKSMRNKFSKDAWYLKPEVRIE